MKPELTQIFLAIPAPGSGEDAWGRTYRLYGIMIAIGVIACLEVARRRWQAKGGDPEDISALALWVVPAGLIGARLYHVITDRSEYYGHWFDNPFSSDELMRSPLAIWKGGLGIPGGLLLGFLAGYVVAKRRGMRPGIVADAIAPGVPLAQAIGRLGNYFNQELYGRPTDLPWGLYVDPAWRVPEYASFDTFQPTFLYEALWSLGLMCFLLWIDKKHVLRPGRLFLLFIGGYFLGRLWVEAMRSDEAKTFILGVRINIWTSLVCVLVVAAVLAFIGLRRQPEDDFRPYADGHLFDHERGIVMPGDAGDAGGADEVAGADPEAYDPDAGVDLAKESPPPDDDEADVVEDEPDAVDDQPVDDEVAATSSSSSSSSSGEGEADPP